jgi:hypothetical protein
MNSSIKNNQNQYEGNGWSKYQLMVLQQLEDHSRVLQNLNKELVDIKQHVAVSEAELKLWRGTTISAIESLEKKMSHVLYDDSGLNKKLSDIENALEVDENTKAKLKAIWAFYGAIAVFLVNFGIKLFELITKAQ